MTLGEFMTSFDQSWGGRGGGGDEGVELACFQRDGVTGPADRNLSRELVEEQFDFGAFSGSYIPFCNIFAFLLLLLADWTLLSELAAFLPSTSPTSLWSDFTFPNIHEDQVSTRDAGLEARKQGMDYLTSLILRIES